LGALLFSFSISLIDGVINFLFHVNEDFSNILFPEIGSYEFYERMMIIATFLIFALLISYIIETKYKVEIQLVESEAKFRTMANYTKDMEYWITPNKELNFISPSVKDLTGYTKEEFLQRPQLIQEIIFHEDKPIFEKHELAALNGKNVSPIEFRIKNKNGKIIWVHHSCQSVNDIGRYMGHRVSNRDITNRKLAEEELQNLNVKLRQINDQLETKVKERTNELNQIFDQSPFGKAVLNKNGEIIKTNKAWHKLFGIDNLEEAKSFFEELLLSNSEIKSCIQECTIKKKSTTSQSFYVDELDKILIFDVYPVLSAEKENSKIVVNVENITDEVKSTELYKELGEQKYTMQKIFEYLELERNRVSKELHDHIGQKLTLSKLGIDLLKQKYPEEEKFDEILTLLGNTNREIREIIHSLFPAELEKYGLLEALQLMVHHCSNVGNFETEIKIYGEDRRLATKYEHNVYRMCTEIFSNIVKHAGASLVKITINMKPDYLSIVVKDNGIGFDQSERNIESLGLLSIKQRAVVLNGELEIRSIKDVGTEIYISIPLGSELALL